MGRKLYKKTIISLIIITLLVDIIINGISIVKTRIEAFNQHHDISFELAQWWRQNIPKEATIVADHPTRVYIPPEYKNIKILRGYKALASGVEVVDQLRQLVSDYHPEYIYYNIGSNGMPKDNVPWPPIDEILHDRNVELIKTFESAGRYYQRYPDDKFVIYKLYYEKGEKW